ncbi:MAG: glycoside hydrolase family 3 N-terminal domain-containing protein, partial [Paucilactobacillus nenjiangensis]
MDNARIASLTNAELIKLTSGKDFWNSESIDQKSINSFRMSDGPNGLRFQALDSDHLGINDSLPNTSFPTASAVASSWNLDLVNQIGAAIGQGANARDVDVVLGPGVNIKRNPLCGRNFEYFSEDPYLSGMLGSSLVTGIQSVGIGACVKHFALNSQENERLVSNSVVDAQAL